MRTHDPSEDQSTETTDVKTDATKRVLLDKHLPKRRKDIHDRTSAEYLAFPDRESSRTLHGVVWRLAWPTVLAMMLQVVNSFVDRFFIHSLGPNALAAAGVVGQYTFLVMSIGMSLSIGTTALVARFTGMNTPEESRVVANQSSWLAVIASFVCVALFMPFRSELVALMHLNDQATRMSISYLTVSLLGTPPLFLMLIMMGAYRGLGNTVTPLVISVLINIVHLTGDYLLISGHLGFPRWGLAGGATALVTSQIVGTIAYGISLRKSPLAGLSRVRSGLELEWARRILKIGIPAALQNLSRIVSMLAFTGVLARSSDGTPAVAALTIGLTMESLAFMPGFGFSTAASALTGQNLGAGRPDRAVRSGWVALEQGLVVMIIMGVVFYVFAPQFTSIFDPGPQATPLAIAYLRISALSEPFLAVGMILTGVLNGAGDTKSPAWATVVSMWIVRLPLAYLLSRTLNYGAIGAWWAMAASTTTGGVIAFWLFRRGRWKLTKV